MSFSYKLFFISILSNTKQCQVLTCNLGLTHLAITPDHNMAQRLWPYTGTATIEAGFFHPSTMPLIPNLKFYITISTVEMNVHV